ncbi:AAC(6')-Ia family aminoglycoside 6'-N-acetyltransferase [Salmonella enterica]|uniref:aminoglycoside 6'-N-acetyltransferase AAC(6')-F309 n=1 Tax=Salmonella enterica TaxID=28901 RepID=UPI00130A2D36|nr:aminoglycoside 6'-N-acetyltransferase AAC(6')-F309 [Salmonella enterica]EKV3946309.1 AAC(6')-Ia family aminoglycoside 6'-N-acetyltransferase [Escherichia coli]EKW8036226.1 AAC(6')-Ia family aminoglycoside 6'-N-acetyltransferase [Pseudomonas aeruginosa]ECZ4807255.1 AAC(6')-Ia family aminoglycoside 6'-N-acetyltransferase [Salmonella enterica]ECZ4807475.1 AAC(6')-Ia family aminoglycoside 6'-N-acetyltransferase [Salmonella enterica]ECZ4902287.1 AAC(6')-Ia family aminoglycoside 6'-N-acetyltransf
MSYTICNIADSNELLEQAAQILTRAFCHIHINSWPDYESAYQEVQECIQKPNICIGVCEKDRLVGWIGLRPMYEKTWELHPIVVDIKEQHKGVGKLLLAEIEKEAKEKNIIGIVLGTDDENYRTSLSQVTITNDNLFNEIKYIRNIGNHPYTFYEKSGYMIVGVIPNANGVNKPDIWMWKGI